MCRDVSCWFVGSGRVEGPLAIAHALRAVFLCGCDVIFLCANVPHVLRFLHRGVLDCLVNSLRGDFRF